MKNIGGVEIIKNSKGATNHLVVEIEKHKDLVSPLLKELEASVKSKFEKDWERGISIEEARKQTRNFIKQMYLKSTNT